MVTQYPHLLVITTVPASTKDGSGNWVTESPETAELSCRAEPNTGKGYISGQNGDQISYDWTVYIPLPVEAVADGTKVDLYNGEVHLSTGTVKRFNKGQLNARIWV